MKFHVKCITSMVCAAFCAGAVSAQETPDATPPKKKTGLPLRLLPVGEPPPFRQEFRDGNRYEVEAPAGSIPPYKIGLGSLEPISFSLGKTTLMNCPPGTETISLTENGESWANITIPERLRSKPKTIVFWREPGKQWDSPRSLVLDDGAEQFSPGAIRVINLLPVTASFKLGAKVEELQAGKSLILPGVKEDTQLVVAFKTPENHWVAVYNGSIEPQTPLIRTQIIIYRADIAEARRPAKTLIHRAPIEAPAN